MDANDDKLEGWTDDEIAALRAELSEAARDMPDDLRLRVASVVATRRWEEPCPGSMQPR